MLHDGGGNGAGNIFLSRNLFPQKQKEYSIFHDYSNLLLHLYSSEMLHVTITSYLVLCSFWDAIYDFFCSWKPTCDVFHKHEDYMQNQFATYQQTIEKDKYVPVLI